MRRKRSSTTSVPPVPGPENIATREYYRACEPNDAHDADMDFPADKPAAPGVPRDHDGGSVRSEEVYDFVEVSTTGPHSPSPSDIVLKSGLRDVAEMGDLDREMRERGVPRGERNKALLELQDRLVAERKRVAEAAEKKRAEELEREYEEVQRKGREEV